VRASLATLRRAGNFSRGRKLILQEAVKLRILGALFVRLVSRRQFIDRSYSFSEAEVYHRDVTNTPQRRGDQLHNKLTSTLYTIKG
jgi:hypothetical protein